MTAAAAGSRVLTGTAADRIGYVDFWESCRSRAPSSIDRGGRVPAVTAARGTETSQVRLAELVAALSLGVDLGFGQPMEHVLRQCLIALRLAERVGLDDDERSVVYYTALLVNVGCRYLGRLRDEQAANGAGDDITLKASRQV